MSEPTIHDYTVREWGHDVTIRQVKKGGKVLEASGWGRGIKKGHVLLLPNGDTSTRYTVKAIRYFADPSDMWSATLRFAPREAGEMTP
jgi:hypothetical protein